VGSVSETVSCLGEVPVPALLPDLAGVLVLGRQASGVALHAGQVGDPELGAEDLDHGPGQLHGLGEQGAPERLTVGVGERREKLVVVLGGQGDELRHESTARSGEREDAPTAVRWIDRPAEKLGIDVTATF
jgi:hypothetical protein